VKFETWKGGGHIHLLFGLLVKQPNRIFTLVRIGTKTFISHHNGWEDSMNTSLGEDTPDKDNMLTVHTKIKAPHLTIDNQMWSTTSSNYTHA